MTRPSVCLSVSLFHSLQMSQFPNRNECNTGQSKCLDDTEKLKFSEESKQGGSSQASIIEMPTMTRH